jgi:8-oxo-dGTP pyrophosphatase MutT (NUDIX family)
MIEFEILSQGLYRTDQLIINYDPSLRMPVNPAIQSWMDTFWQKKLDDARKKGVPLFDTNLFRLVDCFDVRDEEQPPPRATTRVSSLPSTTPAPTEYGSIHDNTTLHLVLGDTSYKEYVTTRVPEFFQGRERQELSNALAVCSVIETSDEYMLLDKRQGVDVYVGRYHVIGGFFERGLDMMGQPDPFGAVRREIREETGIQVDDIREQYCLGVVYDLSTPHGEMCFLTRLHIPLAEVQTRKPEDNEVKELLLLAVTEESLRDFVLHNHGNISPTGEANLLMYGAVRFGAQWFEEMMGRL